MMFGLILIEMESFNESKQTSGYGVVWQNDSMEDKYWECREFVEEDLRAHVVDKVIAERSKNSFRMDEAIEV
jgi:hypothetical protein